MRFRRAGLQIFYKFLDNREAAMACFASNSCENNFNISSAAVNLFGFENDVIQLHERLNFHSISGALLPNLEC